MILLSLLDRSVNSKYLGRFNFFYLSVFIVTAFSGFRFGVGWDYMSYYEAVIYDDNFHFISRNEMITQLLVSISNRFNAPNLFFFINSFITIFLISDTIKKFSINKNISLFIFISFPLFFLNSFSVIRFFTALALTFYGVRFIINKKFLFYLITVLIASFIHKSAFFALPLYFLQFFKFKNIYLFIILVSANILREIFNNLISVYIPQYIGYTESTLVQEGTKAIWLFIFFGLIGMYFKNKYFKDNKLHDLYFNIYIYGLLFYMLFLKQGTLGHRLSLYGTIYLILLLPMYINIIKNVKIKSIAIFFLYSILITSFLFSLHLGSNTYIPYKTIWH